MKLHHLRPAPGQHRRPKRVGRGRASGHGKTSGRGTKGTGARTSTPPWFEGGQMPLHRRVPKLGGFTNRNRVEYQVVNVEALSAFGAGATVDLEALRARGLAGRKGPVKILGRGDLAIPLTVRADAFSTTASTKIEAAGGRAEVI